MGYAIHWVAVKGANLQAACSVLGLQPTGERVEIAECPMAGGELPSGSLLLSNGTMVLARDREPLASALGFFARLLGKKDKG